MAFRNDSSADVIMYLVDLSPIAQTVADNRGRLPLHLAAASDRVTLRLVRAMLERCPGAVRVADSERNLPLHVALSERRPLEIVRFLIEQHLDSLLHRNGAGLLPVQMALSDGHWTMDAIQFMIQQRKESLQERDADGRVLLHFVLSLYYRPNGVDQYIMEQWPEALQVRDSSGLLPLHVAASNMFMSLGLVYRLAREKPELLRIGGGGISPRESKPNPDDRSGLRGGAPRRAKKRGRT